MRVIGMLNFLEMVSILLVAYSPKMQYNNNFLIDVWNS